MGTRREQLTSIGLLILRVGICIFMANHGYGKYQMLQAGEIEKFVDPWGVMSNRTALIMTIVAELACPVLVAIGFLTRLATIPTIFAMATAVFLVHTKDPWFMSATSNGKEPAMLFLIPYLTLLFTGAGRYSVDGMIWPVKQDVY